MPLKEIIPSERFLEKTNIDNDKKLEKNSIGFQTEIILSNDEDEVFDKNLKKSKISKNSEKNPKIKNSLQNT